MSARFKGPFKKSSFNFGMRMLDRLFIRPATKLGSAAIKDLTSTKKSSYSSYTSHDINQSRRSSIYSQEAQERLREQEIGLKEFKYVSSLVKKLAVESSIAPDVLRGVSKIYVAINRYINKGTSYGMDLYSFVENFCTDQIANLKTDKSRWEYEIARKTIKAVNAGYSYENLVELLRSITIK